MSFGYSLVAAFVPMFLYLLFLWRFDRNEREAFKDVLKHFLWGALGAVFLALIFSSIFGFALGMIVSSESQNSFLSAVIIAPFVEEITKGVYLFKSIRKNYFDNITDGLVYGGAIGLGFGMTENIMYFSTYNDTFEQWISIVIVRSIFSAVMHAIATATLGAFIAKSKFSNNGKKILPLIGLFLAMSFHTIWNFSLSFDFTYLIGIGFMFFLIASFIFVFKFSLRTENNIISDELASEGVIPNEHIDILSTNRKFGRKWINKSLRKDYVRFATLLAFRKFQSRNTNGVQQQKYLDDIVIYRERVRNILSKQNV